MKRKTREKEKDKANDHDDYCCIDRDIYDVNEPDGQQQLVRFSRQKPP
jgi:hypothetical protein